MAISIEFLGMQRLVTNIESINMPITAGKTRVNDALAYVREKYPDLHLDEARILIAVNLEMASPDKILKDNDTISFLPLIGGG
jgi:molybdopterin converting factor small subunit